MSDEYELDARALAWVAREASRDAVKETFEQGRPITVQIRKDIVRLYPDGHKAVIGKLEKSFMRPKSKTYHL